MPREALLDTARVYCRLASLVRVESVPLAERLIDSAVRILEGKSPVWDEGEELQRAYLAEN